MKKKVLIICGIVAVVAIVALIAIFSNSGNPKEVEGVDLSNTTGAEAFINKVYEPLGENLPGLMTSVVDVTDLDSLKYFTGLSSAEGIEYAIASEPMMSSQAYSLVLVKTTEGTDVEKVKKEIFENVDTRKWICVEAEDVYATNYNDTVIFVMGAKDWAVPVYDSIKNILGNTIGTELKEVVEINMQENLDGQEEVVE